MKDLASVSLSHPAVEILALHLRGELALISRLRCKWHLSSCPECRAVLQGLRSSFDYLRSEAASEAMPGYSATSNWTRLEREMAGNIVVGVAAARCIDKVGKKRRWIPTVAVATGLSAVFAVAWQTHIPPEQTNRILAAFSQYIHGSRARPSSSVVQTTPTGIAVRSQGVTLTILHPRTALVSVSGASAVEARFIDEDSGQVTITNVYGQ